MKSYNNFIGIDIGKFEFVVNVFGSKKTETISNDRSGIKQFIRSYKKILPLQQNLWVLGGSFNFPS